MIRGRLAAGTLASLLGDWRGESPAYEALAERIQLLLIDGRISADVRLPSERELSDQLELSRTTITAAYGVLRDFGYARSVQGSGTTTLLPPTVPAPIGAASRLIDLAIAALPATRLLGDAAAWATERLEGHVATSGYHLVGLPELRSAIAERYSARGLPTTPDQILVTNGAQSAIALVTRSLIARGDRAYAESPSYPHAYDALRLAGARIVTSPVTTDLGWDTSALEATFARTTPVMAYVMPDFHNPTGRSMTLDDRHRLLRAAAKVDAVVVADETSAELDIDRPTAFGPLATLAGEHRARVVHLGSASKLYWGGLRIGWVRADTELLNRIIGLRAAADLGTPVWEQLTTTALIPHTEDVIEERREQLRARRTVLSEGIAALLPDWQLPPELHGGLAAWVQLPQPVSSQLTLAARGANIHLTAGPRFGADGAFERHLRIPLTASPDDLSQVLDVLGRLWPRIANSPLPALAASDPVI